MVVDCCSDPLLPSAVLGFMAVMVFPNPVLTVANGVSRKRRAAPAGS
jgi:hypothetical protein